MTDDARARELLEEVLDSGRTPEEVCAEFPALLSEVRHRWKHCGAVNAQIDLLFPPSDPSAAAQHRRQGAFSSGHLPHVPGYDVQEILGRGGMGVVYKATHLKLRRTVALKMLIAGVYASPHEVARFARESQVVAGIRDAHIVDVHDVGEFEGRPYFTMQFIEGGNLAQKLVGAPQPARESADLLRKLARAVEAAHESGVVHRDLKPSNILLTSDGTPKISDFGLARRLANEPELTLSGTRVGTPSYMAPEQVIGKAGAAGPLVDVYALGAILYEMLTGRPPFTSASAIETQRQVIEEEPVPPSRLNGKVPRDLQTICLKCLQKDPQRRYGTALALAEDLDRFLNGEPVAARPARFPERATKWVQRHPSEATLITAGLVAVFVILAAALSAHLQKKALARVVDDDLQEVTRKEFTADWSDARTALARAKVRLGEGDPSLLSERVARAESDLNLVSRLAAILLDRSAVVEGRFDFGSNKSRADAAYESAFRDAGFGTIGDEPRSVAKRVAASTVQNAIVAALDDWAFCTRDNGRQDWLLTVARLADHQSGDLSNRVRDPASWRNKDALIDLAGVALASKASVQLLVALGERLQDAGADPVPFLRRVQQEHPDDFWANFALGETLRKQHSIESVRYFQAAVAIQPGAAASYNNLGISLFENGRTDEAVDYFQLALKINRDYAPAHNNLGACLTAQGKFENAIGHFERALKSQPNDSDTHDNLGIALASLSRWNEAIPHYREAIRIAPNDAHPHNNLGISLRNIGHIDEALAHFKEAVRLAPVDADALNNFGIALRDKERVPEAVDVFLRALKVRPDFPEAHGNLGIAYSMMNEVDQSIEHFRKALALNETDAENHINLGLALVRKGDLNEAIVHYRRAIELAPTNASAHNNLGLALSGSGSIDDSIVQFKEAIRLDPNEPSSRQNLANAQGERERRLKAPAP